MSLLSIATGHVRYAEVLDQLATQEGDMWSLGMILYVLLNGQEPSINQANAFESLESKLVFPNITPIHLSEMCRALLRSDPFKRPTIDQILQACFRSCLKNDETLIIQIMC